MILVISIRSKPLRSIIHQMATIVRHLCHFIKQLKPQFTAAVALIMALICSHFHSVLTNSKDSTLKIIDLRDYKVVRELSHAKVLIICDSFVGVGPFQ
jgi:hypothetical protein